MIIATRIFAVNPETRDGTLAAMMKWSKVARQTPGCITHGYYADIDDAEKIRFYGEFESVDAMRSTTDNLQMAAFWEVINSNGVTTVSGDAFTATPISEHDLSKDHEQ